MTIKVGMVSLGCPKNQMDAELMLARLEQAGYEMTAESGLADVVIVNTCGFIEDAKKESIENILEFAQLKQEGRIKHILVTGCLAERYQQELVTELPECDGVLGLGANADIVEAVRRVTDGAVRFPAQDCWRLEGDRLQTTPRFFAYLRIGDGCDNRCTYCAIPRSGAGAAAARWRDWSAEATTLAADRGEGADAGGARHHRLRSRSVRRAPPTPAAAAAVRHRRDAPDPAAVLLPGAHHRRVAGRDGDGGKGAALYGPPLQHVSGQILTAMNRPGDRESAAGADRPSARAGAGHRAAHHPDDRLPRRGGGGI